MIVKKLSFIIAGLLFIGSGHLFAQLEKTSSTYTKAKAYSISYLPWTSTNKDNGSMSQKDYSFHAKAGDHLSFDWATSSEEYCDKLVGILDDAYILTQSGVDKSGTYETDFTTDGEHKLSFIYAKDYFSSDGNDEVHVSNIKLDRFKDTLLTDYYEITPISSSGVGTHSYTLGTISTDYENAQITTNWSLTKNQNPYYDIYTYTAYVDGEKLSYDTYYPKGEYEITAKTYFYSTSSSGRSSQQITIYGINAVYTLPEEIDEITFYDSETSNISLQSAITAQTMNYYRPFSNANWQSLYVPFTISYEDWKDDYEIARINNVHQYDDDDDGNIDRTELEVVKLKSGEITANTPYLIKAKSAGKQGLSLSNVKFEPTVENTYELNSWNTNYKFYCTYNPISGQTMLDNGYYAMGGGALVQAQDADSDLGAFRWYMSVTDRNGNKQSLNNVRMEIRCLDDEEETAVNNIKAEARNENTTYDLSGREIPSAKLLKPGIYVRNGKKFTVK